MLGEDKGVNIFVKHIQLNTNTSKHIMWAKFMKKPQKALFSSQIQTKLNDEF